VVLAVAGVVGVVILFASSRDDATTSNSVAPGVAAPAPTGPLAAALRRGNVVLRHGGDVKHAAAQAAARRLAGRDTPALRSAGQAVIVVADPAVTGVVVRAWRRRLTARSPGNPRVQEFVEFWLGRGDRE
jgi:hypothetical protein